MQGVPRKKELSCQAMVGARRLTSFSNRQTRMKDLRGYGGVHATEVRPRRGMPVTHGGFTPQTRRRSITRILTKICISQPRRPSDQKTRVMDRSVIVP